MQVVRHARRGGFTLIELLVVISLIAALAALSAGAFFRVRNAQQTQATNATLNKLHSLMDMRWKAIIDQARNDMNKGKIPPLIMTFAANDLDRARSIWTYMLLTNEFPTTFDEATTPVFVNGAFLPPRTVFAQLPASNATKLTTLATAPLAPGQLESALAFQSAACFYVAISATGNRGNAADSDGTTNQARDYTDPVTGATARVFVDSFGTPIGFFRMSYAPELNFSPYTTALGGKILSNDPLDPLGRLPGTWANTTTAGNTLSNGTIFWSSVAGYHIFLTTPSSITGNMPWAPRNTPGEVPPVYPGSVNWVPTLVSAGMDRTWNDNGTLGFFGGDNIVSFRLRRQGARGDF
ncbi:prepilin-type N-terminal cleavage/methylation domain-containing protein [Fimbriiglobus ruber]|uniref:Prepilin-type N-terminal cleavage/methylation domain-containing protein n=1 Tax=Fimbriiglobus ruber TaxID=1908690 RepID=A0A225DQE2_9BACT|nr:prepilin-type N-terminal cleavage/methylation domain-containing protein [Fimbriiglobus ruber]OWK43612.1 hypothetical protein FRUB_03211 [Fimbriiglobus ruber]